jgi:two-component system, NarL family, nitrate/nitrite response regulator NarL
MNPPSVRLMLVDDHRLVREGLRARLEAVSGFLVVAEADSAEAALEAARQAAPDVVLMDVGLRGGANGIAATRALRALAAPPCVLMLSMHDNPAVVREALAAGASGYLLKDSPAEELVLAIRAAMAGGTHIAADLASSMAAAPARGGASLTPREREVLALIAEGLTSKDIGERLGMGVRTVETHRTSLRRKLDLPSPAALVRYAVEQRR